MKPTHGDYVLGSHGTELDRLGVQHTLWRDLMLDGWRRAGLGPGTRVVDVGAGPGFATADLSTIVGATGAVTAVDRSSTFLATLQARFAEPMSNVTIHEVDLMREAIPCPNGNHDAAWCRWVAMFVPDPALLLERIDHALKPGGVVILHEYCRYETLSMLPRRSEIDSFTALASKSFRAAGGEPDIAGVLLATLVRRGFEVCEVRPIARGARFGDPLWQWPAGFVRTYAPRLVELGFADAAWCAGVLHALEAAEQDGVSLFLTPMVLEIIARKPVERINS